MSALVLDIAQPRVTRNEMALLVSGEDWDIPRSSGVYDGGVFTRDIFVDPISRTAMLCPACFNPSWTTLNSGAFAKYAKADLTFPDATVWGESPIDGGGNFLVYGAAGTTVGNTSDVSFYTASLSANQGMVLEWHSGQSTQQVQIEVEGGWSSGFSGSAGVSWRLYSDGKMEIWKNGNMVGGPYSLHAKHEYIMQPQAPGAPQAPNNEFVQVLFLPFRDRDLLVLTSKGGGFVHTFDDLDENSGTNTITDAAPFWVSFKAPLSPTCRLAKAQFAVTNGIIYGPPSAWKDIPPTDLPQTKIFQPNNTGGGSVALAVDTTGPNPFSLPNPARLKVTLNGSATVSPWVLGARAWFSSDTSDTPGADADLTEYLTAGSVTISSILGGDRAEFELNQPTAVESAAPQFLEISRRPAEVPGFLTGLVDDPPQFVASRAIDTEDLGPNYELNQRMNLSVRDVWKLAEDHVIAESIPLDGMTLPAAYTYLAGLAGLTADVSDSLSSFTFPKVNSSGHGEWGALVTASDKLSDWLERLHTTYAGNCFHGVSADGTLQLLAPEDLPSTPAITLYPKIQDAIDAGVSETLAPYRVYRELNWRYLQPEANYVSVVGVDPFTRKPIYVHRKDGASITPSTAPDLRPGNWLGGIKAYAWCDPTLRTKDACTWALDKLFDRLTKKRRVVEFVCEAQESLPKNAIVKLKGAIGGADVNLRIRTADIQFISLADGWKWRPARYTGEDTSSGLVSQFGVPGQRAEIISRHWKNKSLSDQSRWEKAVFALARPTLIVSAS